MKRNPLKTAKVEHRGFDLSATKNFDLEMKLVKTYNRPSKANTKQSDMTKYIK